MTAGGAGGAGGAAGLGGAVAIAGSTSATTGTTGPTTQGTGGATGQGSSGADGGAGKGSTDSAGKGGTDGAGKGGTDGGTDGAGKTEAKGPGDPGRGSNRYEHLRNAQQTFGGDAVAGDKFVFYMSGGLAAPAPQPLSQDVVDLVRHTFVEPEGWDRVRQRFHEQRTVVLSGTAGHGRETAAVRLLQTVDAQLIYLLDPRVDLRSIAERLAKHQIGQGTAFLLKQPHDLGGLDIYVVNSLQAALAAADARLVVTIGVDTPLHDTDVLQYQIDLPEAPGRRLILERHLSHLLDDEVRAAEILAQKDIEEIIAERLDVDGATCDIAAEIALYLSREDPVDADRLRDLLRRRSSDKFDAWFGGLPDLTVRTFAIALAVLNGLPYEDVAHAARRLHVRLSRNPSLRKTDEGDSKAKAPDYFRTGLTGLRRALAAKVTEHDLRIASLQAVPATRIAYENGKYPKRVLRKVWQGFQVQEELLDWLGDLVRNGSDQVRAFAATALGVLSTLAFEHVFNRVLAQWAGNQDEEVREAVAAALARAAQEPALRPIVQTVVNSWYGNRDAPLQQATAAVTIGTAFGDDPVAAFESLHRLAMVPDFDVHLAIGHGLAALVIVDADARAAAMYDVLTRCLLDEKRAIAAQWMFLEVANNLACSVGQDDATSVPWPALLYLATKRADLREPLFRFWAVVLTEGQAIGYAVAVLKNWAAFAEGHEPMREAFIRMVRAVALIDPRAAAEISRLGQLWNSDDELLPLPAISKSIGAVITG